MVRRGIVALFTVRQQQQIRGTSVVGRKGVRSAFRHRIISLPCFPTHHPSALRSAALLAARLLVEHGAATTLA